MKSDNTRIPNYKILYRQLVNDISTVINVYNSDHLCEPIIYRLNGVLRQADDSYLAQIEARPGMGKPVE